MPEYVYALHDFQPEKEDEVPFSAGERIEVLDKDDEYGDGWWTGRNLSGRVGLFPQTYTTPAPPSAPPAPVAPVSDASSSQEIENGTSSRTSTLESVPEHPEHPEPPAVTANAEPAPSIHSNASRSIADSSSPYLIPDSEDFSPLDQDGGRMMRATLTDVQKAIEQLGRGDRDGARSFSFSSSRDDDRSDRETETEVESDMDPSDADGDNDGTWHKDARQKLAEKARKAAEREQRRRDREDARTNLGARAIAPPIEVELSDESEGEDDHRPDLRHLSSSGSYYQRQHSDILEENEEVEDDSRRRTVVEEPEPTATATRTTFPPIQAPQPTLYPAADLDPRAQRLSALYPTVESSEPSPDPEEPASMPTPVSPSSHLPPVEPIAIVAVQPMAVKAYSGVLASFGAPTVSVTPPPLHARDYGVAQIALPSPAASSFSQPRSLVPINTGTSSASSADATKVNSSELTVGQQKNGQPAKVHPSDWTVDEVIEWLKGKGFDQGVCDKFIEQEITGDVLLELDANLLKTEIGIVAFGKRVRIANAISELKRPASFTYEPEPERERMAPFHSHHSSITTSSAAGLSPIGVVPGSAGLPPPVHTPASAHYSMQSSGAYSGRTMPSVVSEESPPHTGDSTGQAGMYHNRRRSDLSESVASSIRWNSSQEKDAGLPANDPYAFIGLGLGVPGPVAKLQTRPAMLSLSPSENNLSVRAMGRDIPEEAEAERAAMSESETTKPEKSKRRHLFGRSLESTIDKDKDATSPQDKRTPSPSPASEKRKSFFHDDESNASVRSRQPRTKKTSDARPADRLSIFGGIGGSIGKSRKPPPRYSTAADVPDVPSPEKSSRILYSLYHSHSKKAGAKPDGKDISSPVDNKSEKDYEQDGSKVIHAERPLRDPALLRKRNSQGEPQALGAGDLKAGQSILEQIGTPDHEGWMRKKGERYNSWKTRYFVLKGPHLYCLRSDSKQETKIKGYTHIVGYRIIADENIDPGRYGFRLVNDSDKPSYFSSEEKSVIREWMKALMKATITRDYQKPVISSVNIPTIPLAVAQTMNPAPRPPSPGARDATQKAMRRENPNQLSTRDARILMGIPSVETGANEEQVEEKRVTLPNLFAEDAPAPVEARRVVSSPVPVQAPRAVIPPRPSRETRRTPSETANLVLEPSLIEWANSHLPAELQITDTSGSICGGLALLRMAESIKGKPASPPVPDAAFPTSATDDKLDGLFRLFDYLLDNDVKMGSVSINDIRQGKREKIIQLIKALKAWEDKRRQLAESLGKVPTMQGSPTTFMMPVSMNWGSL